MRITWDYRQSALAAAKKLQADARDGIPIPEMDGLYVIQKGRAPDRDAVEAILRDDDGIEYEVYSNGNGHDEPDAS